MADLRKAAVGFSERLARAATDDAPGRLRSIVLHGSVARGEAVEGLSDVNLMVLVDAVDPPLLRRLAPLARDWLEAGRALPLVLTWDEWRAASDAFAIETADMLDAREILHGDDPLKDAFVRPDDLRLQAERELRAKLITLREGTLAAADRPRDLGRLLMLALPSVATYLRAALRLAGRAAPTDSAATLREGATLVGADPAQLDRLWTLRRAGKAPETEVDDPLVGAVHAVLEQTTQYVDRLGDTRP